MISLVRCWRDSANRRRQGFVPLPKSVTPQRIEENANIYDFQLSDSDMKKLDIDAYEPSAPGWDPTKEP